MIRAMKVADIPKVVDLLKVLHSRSKYRLFKPHWPRIIQTLNQLSVSQDGSVEIAEEDGVVTGILAGMVEEYWWTEDRFGARYATDILFFSRNNDGEELMRRFVDWAFSRPRVVRVECGVSSGLSTPDAASRFYKGLGFEYHGPMFEAIHPKLSGKSTSGGSK